MGTPLEYQIGGTALAVVLKQSMAALFPNATWLIEENKDKIDTIAAQGFKVGLDAVDKHRAHIEALKGMD